MKIITRLTTLFGTLVLCAAPQALLASCGICGSDAAPMPPARHVCDPAMIRARTSGNSGTLDYSGSAGSSSSQADRQRQIQQWQQQQRKQREESLRKIQRTYEGLAAAQNAFKEAQRERELEWRQRELDESEQEERELRGELLRAEIELKRKQLEREAPEPEDSEAPLPSTYQPLRPDASDLADTLTPRPRPAPAQPLFRESLSSFLSSGPSPSPSRQSPSRVVTPSLPVTMDDTATRMALSAMMSDLISGSAGETARTPEPVVSARSQVSPASSAAKSVDEYRKRLEVNADDEWRVLKPLIENVLAARQAAGGTATMRSGVEAEALREALATHATTAVLKAHLEGLRARAGEAAVTKDARLEAEERRLRGVLTVRQEATAVLLGLLQ